MPSLLFLKKMLLPVSLSLLLALVVLVEISFIPAWEKPILLAVASLFLFSAFLSILFLISVWINYLLQREQKRLFSWIKPFLGTLLLLSIYVGTFFFILSSDNYMVFGPNFKFETVLEGHTFYVYENSCFVPDSACECDYYFSDVYLKKDGWPLKGKVKRVSFYVSGIRAVEGGFELIPENRCVEPSEEEKRINL